MTEKKDPPKAPKPAMELLADTEASPSRELKKINWAQDEYRKLFEPAERVRKLFEPTLLANDSFLKASEALRKSFEPTRSAYDSILKSSEAMRKAFEPASLSLRNFQILNRTAFDDLTKTQRLLADSLAPTMNLQKIFKFNLDLGVHARSTAFSEFFDTSAREWQHEWDRIGEAAGVSRALFESQRDASRIFKSVEAALNFPAPELEKLNSRLAAAVSTPIVSKTLSSDAPKLKPASEVTKPRRSGRTRKSKQYAWAEWLKGLSPAAQVFVVAFFVLILQPAIQALWAEAIERILSTNDPKAQVQIIQESSSYFGDDRASALRCVRASVLVVRRSPSRTSAAAGRLASTQAVEVLETRGAWSMIRYKDAESGFIKQGWAASAYLAKYAC